jgi:hypothetical protein
MAVDQKPDFSGEYILNRQASALSPHASAIDAGTLCFEHQEPLLRCEAKFTATQGHPVQFKFESVSDGREVTGEMGGTTIVSSVHWEESALVCLYRITGQGFEMNMSWRYELLDGERSLRATEQIRGAGRDQDNVWIFERTSAGAPTG